MDGAGSTTARVRLSLVRLGLSPATRIYLWSRAAIWLSALLVSFWVTTSRSTGYGTSLWMRWDADWYTRIAQHGYATDTNNAPAFFPLYPAAIRVLGEALGGSYQLAGLLISLVSCVVAFELLWRLVKSRLGAEDAERTVLYLALFPMALFLQAVYTESLYLALVLIAFTLAERNRWAGASVACGFAILARSSGFALLGALVVLAWPDRRRLATLVVAPLMFLAFPALLWVQVHHPFAFVTADAEWNRHVSRAGPFGGLWDAFARLGDHPKGATLHHALAVNIEDLVYLALAVALMPIVWKQLGRAWGTFAALSVLLPLSTPVRDYPLLSFPRFVTVIFPLFVALAILGRNPRVHTAIVAVSTLLLGVSVTLWVTFQWVS